VLGSEAELLRELILKNLYILTTNIAGLVVGGTVGELWEQHQALARSVADEVLSIQEWLGGVSLVREPMLTELAGAFAADSAHQCTGRSAPARLARALGHADAAGLAVPKLREIQAGLG
jgi:hypothetical protein